MRKERGGGKSDEEGATREERQGGRSDEEEGATRKERGGRVDGEEGAWRRKNEKKNENFGGGRIVDHLGRVILPSHFAFLFHFFRILLSSFIARI